MSIKAYKIIEIKTAEISTFDVTHLPAGIKDHLDIDEQLNMSGGGYITILKEDIESAYIDAEDSGDKEAMEVLQSMLNDCGENECVDYSCV